MSLQTLYEKLDKAVHIFSRRTGAKRSAKHYFRLRKSQNLPIVRLTAGQKAQVRKAWNGKCKDYATHELVLSASGRFDPYVCSELFFRTKIETVLNNQKFKYGFSDKNYFDMLLPGIPAPKTLLRNINGVLLDAQYRPMTQEAAMELLQRYDRLFVKPSIENGCGRNAALLQREEFSAIPSMFRKNYLVQEVFDQHPDVAALNPTSVNVVRVISLSLNGRVSPVNYTLRCGAAGSVTDNHITRDGRGMFVIGVEADGTLKNEAYYSCGEQITAAPNGTAFAGRKLPNFPEALALTTRIHETIPHFGFMGFDVCFDKDGTPTIMEFNIRGPGVLYYQYANGPLFGSRTQEVIDAFCK